MVSIPISVSFDDKPVVSKNPLPLRHWAGLATTLPMCQEGPFLQPTLVRMNSWMGYMTTDWPVIQAQAHRLIAKHTYYYTT